MTEDSPSFDHLRELLGKIDPVVLQQVMPLTGGVITVMFTDIVDSTRVKAQLGDRAYLELLKRHNVVVRECASAHRGRELKTIGDAFLVGFAVPCDATNCAMAIQQRLASSPIAADTAHLKVRIGLHTGTPIVYRDAVSNLIDLSGTDVDKAARVEGLALGGQVLISEETRILAKPKEVYDWGPWELKGLGRHRIFELLWPERDPERPSGRTWRAPVRFLTRFVAREAELAELMDAVNRERLITLTGMGGIGKTRLAHEVASRVSQRFDDGVFFVELAETRNEEGAVVSELLAKLEVNPAGFADEKTALLIILQNRNALLVLDNFETVMSATPLIDKILRQCPGLRLLITSQRSLGVSGEQKIEILPMAVPAIHASVSMESLGRLESFQLFRDRARLKKAGWDAKLDEASLIAQILELTDGIPLSIELGAAWVDRIALRTLRDGLKEKHSVYLRRSGPTVEEKRHAGITACIDWSFNLLSPDEQALFIRVSVFVGGFFPEDAAHVCQVKNALSLLDELRGRSLLLWEESLGITRYRMLRTVRECAAARLGDQADALQLRHAQHFLEILKRAVEQIQGREQINGIARISVDLENIRAGIETAMRTRNYRMIVKYSPAFAGYLEAKGRIAEFFMLAKRALSAANELEDINLIAGCQNNLGVAYAQLPTGDRGANLQKAIACYEAALRVRTEQDFPVDWAMTQNNLGIAYRNLPTGDRGANLQRAIACYEAALRVYTERDFPMNWAMTQNNLGNAYAELPTGVRGANLQRAIACYEAALRAFEAAGLTDDAQRVKEHLASLKTGR